jgi:hypothetical protein
MAHARDTISFLIVVGLAALLDRFARIDATTFIAASALWYGIRAWGKADHVSTVHKNKIVEE